MELTLLYFAGCPNWAEAESRLRAAMDLLDIPPEALTLHRVESEEEAQAGGFQGSPSFLKNGRDLFPDPSAAVGLACRLYRSGGRLTGAPSVDDFIDALGG
jgi:hypothetical protein